MLQMEATRTLEGKADVASKVTLSVFGTTSLAGVGTSEVLYQGQLSNTLGTLYTVATDVTAFITDMTVVNTDSSTHTFVLYVGPTSGAAAGQAITPTFTLPADGMATYADGQWSFYDSTGHRLNTTT